MSDAAGYGIGVAVAVVLIAALTPAAMWWRNRRLTRVAARYPQARLVVGVAKAPGGPNTAVLVVDADALRLLRLGGTPIAQWTWPSVRSVRREAVRFGLFRWKGLTVEVVSQWEPTVHFVVFRSSWWGSSPSRTGRTAEAIAACLPDSGPSASASQ